MPASVSVTTRETLAADDPEERAQRGARRLLTAAIAIVSDGGTGAVPDRPVRKHDERPPLSHDAILTELVVGFGRTPSLLEEMAAYWLILVQRMRQKRGRAPSPWVDSVIREYSRGKVPLPPQNTTSPRAWTCCGRRTRGADSRSHQQRTWDLERVASLGVEADPRSGRLPAVRIGESRSYIRENARVSRPVRRTRGDRRSR